MKRRDFLKMAAVTPALLPMLGMSHDRRVKKDISQSPVVEVVDTIPDPPTLDPIFNYFRTLKVYDPRIQDEEKVVKRRGYSGTWVPFVYTHYLKRIVNAYENNNFVIYSKYRAMQGKNSFYVVKTDYKECYFEWTKELPKIRKNLGELAWRQEVLQEFIS